MPSAKEREKQLFNPETRIISFAAACHLIKTARGKELVVTLAQGVFDILHLGHLEYLTQAKKDSDVLIVGVENDAAVRLNKGESRPIHPLVARLEMLAALRVVDFTFGYEDHPKYAEDSALHLKRLALLHPTNLAVSDFDQEMLQIKQEQASQTGVAIKVLAGEKITSTTQIITELR